MDVVVVGSLNLDVSVMSPRHPRPGETVIGSGHYTGPGGKGANQAVAAARMGAEVAMVGRVGDDAQGSTLIEGLVAAGVDVSGVSVDPGSGTGLALITIDDAAENTIVVSPGANMTLSPEHLQDCADLLQGAGVVMAQLEIPIDAVLAAAGLTGGVFCLNPAPAQPLPPSLLRRVDVLVPNRGELGMLSEADVSTIDDAVAAARSLEVGGAIVVTLGAEGAVVIDGGKVTEIPPISVDAVDPTGAGDAFCGALASVLSRGQALDDAARWATAAGALAVTRRGAQAAMPVAREVEDLLAR